MESIKILGEVYKFKNKRYNINENNYFTIDCVNFVNNNQINIPCLLKTIKGCIDNIEFDYKNLLKDLKLNQYLQHQDNVNFVNECSLKYNNKSWFNLKIDELCAIAQSSSSIQNNLINIENEHIDIKDLKIIWNILILEIYNINLKSYIMI